jgi:hypothetical protein
MFAAALSRRSLIATGLAAGTAAAFAPAFAQQRMTAEKMRDLIEYTTLKERFSVTLNLPEQRVILFSRTEDAIYFHLTGVHLRREKSAINRREGASLWTAAEAATDFARQMTYWAGRSTT